MKCPVGVVAISIGLFLGVPYLLLLAHVSLAGDMFLAGLPIRVIDTLSHLVNWPSYAVLVIFLQFTTNPFALVGFYCFLVLAYLAVGVGLLRLQNWSRLILLALTILNLVTALGAYAGPRMVPFGQPVVTPIIELVVLIYLFRPEVKKAFGATGL